MANITVNEISNNYTYNIGDSSYCTVALPITACWGPAFMDIASTGRTLDDELEATTWQRFTANQSGLESFVSTYRGPSANYRIVKDYSYYMAVTLLTKGYDVLVCRVCPGTNAQTKIPASAESNYLSIKALYPGTFGNNLKVKLTKRIIQAEVKEGETVVTPEKSYINLIVYVVDSAGNTNAVENVVFVLDAADATDSIPFIGDVESKYLTFSVNGTITSTLIQTTDYVALSSGSDDFAVTGTSTASDIMTSAIGYATIRYGSADGDYVSALTTLKTSNPSITVASSHKFREWVFTACTGGISSGTVAKGVYDLLEDKLSYNPGRLISPWDDQNILFINPSATVTTMSVSPMHKKLMDVAYYSRCATAYLDIPKSLPRSAVWNDDDSNKGYAQKLTDLSDSFGNSLYGTHSALFAPWGQYTYVGTSRQAPATPSFLALLIDRGMIVNQSIQYEWAMPSSRKNNVSVGKLDYTVPKTLLDNWQSSEGTRVNVITNIPDMGTTIWGNATLFNVPLATYQALMNLSTRKIFNAVEDVIFKVGLGITFQYSNSEAYSKFYAGVTPTLDTMRNVGAISDYYVTMAADINGLDSVNANSVVGKVVLVINGVIENLTIDLIALPQGADLTQYTGV